MGLIPMRTFFIRCFLLVLVSASCWAAEPPANYVSLAKLQIGNLREVPRFYDGTPVPESFDATLVDILESAELKKNAMAMAKFKYPDLKECWVDIKARRQGPSRIIFIFGLGEEPNYTKVFLDCVLDAFGEQREGIWEMERDIIKRRRELHLESLKSKLEDAERSLAKEKTEATEKTVRTCKRAFEVATDAQTRWELDMAGRIDVISISERASRAYPEQKK